jgi:hypothetical protein
MPMTQVTQRWTQSKLLPVYLPEEAVELPINLAPSTVFAQGTVLGRVGTAAAADVQTLATATGTITAGTFTLAGTNPVTGAPFTTAAIAYNAIASAVATAVQAALGAGITAAGGGGPLPGTPVTLTFGGAAAALPVAALAVANAGLTGGTLGVTHTATGRSVETYAPYADANSDGTQTARCILPYACATDPQGNVTYGAQAGGGFWGESYPCTTAYFAGYFDTSKLVGLDANGVADLGKLIAGTVAAGILAVTGV